MRYHQGIRIDHIPVEGAGGLIFVLGISVLFWLAVPAFRPLVLGSVIAGLLFAPIFHRLGR